MTEPELDLGSSWDPSAVPTLADWDRLAARATPHVSEPVVDVLISAYGVGDDVLRSIYSVLTAQPRTAHAVIVLDGPSQDPVVAGDLARLADSALIELHRDESNVGFAASCNRVFGLHPERDIVVLHAGTLVYNDWLDRLRAHALSDPTSATVTPLSDSDQIASYPNAGSVNVDPLELSPAELDRLAAVTNAGIRVDAPTAGDSCMYLTRACLESTGGFDAETYGDGHGAASELCRQASAAGMRNVVVADVYVWHGANDSEQTRRHAARKVERRNPGFLSSIRAYLQDDPLLDARRRLDAARIARNASPAEAPATLHVLHHWGGGAERHVVDLRGIAESAGRASYLCQPKRPNETYFIHDASTSSIPNLQTFTFADSPERMRGLFEILRLDAIHVHQLIGFPDGASDYFIELAADLGVPLDLTIHDYTSICPQVHLISFGGIYCGEPHEDVCQRCVNSLGSPFGQPVVWLWRRAYERLLRAARSVTVPSHDVAKRLERYFPGVEFTIDPHDEPITRPVDRSRPTAHDERVTRIGVIGALAPHKGEKVVLELARVIAERNLPIEIVVIGYATDAEALTATGRVSITGRYQESELSQLIHDAGLDLIWFPVVVPETYCYALTPAMETDLPIAAFDLGAIAERLRAADRGHHLLPLGLTADPAALLEAITAIHRPASAPTREER